MVAIQSINVDVIIRESFASAQLCVATWGWLQAILVDFIVFGIELKILWAFGKNI